MSKNDLSTRSKKFNQLINYFYFRGMISISPVITLDLIGQECVIRIARGGDSLSMFRD